MLRTLMDRTSREADGNMTSRQLIAGRVTALGGLFDGMGVLVVGSENLGS